MRVNVLAPSRAKIGVMVGLIAVLPWTTPAADGLSWRADHGEVRVVCPLTVGGSFEAKTMSITGHISSPGRSTRTGDFSVDLTTLDTGIDLRNNHMKNTYLEVGKGEGFEKAVLSEIQLGNVDLDTFQGRTSFTGVLLLHGTKRMITGQLQMRRSQASVRVEASFPVALADYGIAKPRYLGVGVKNEVQVKVDFVAVPALVSSAGASR